MADSISMTRFVDDSIQQSVDPSSHGGLAFSPDRTKFVVVIKKGNIQENTNQYSLLLFQMSELVPAASPISLAVLNSSSNRPAITQVRWLSDNNTILFLGEHPQESTQLYSVECRSRHLRKLTNQPTNIVAYTATATGSTIAYIAEQAVTYRPTQSDLKNGIHITTQWLADLIAGHVEESGLENHDVFIKIGNRQPRQIEVQGKLFSYNGGFQLSIAPTGEYLAIQTEPQSYPEAWQNYKDPGLQPLVRDRSTSGVLPHIRTYQLVHTSSGKITPLLNAPIPFSLSEMVWLPEGHSIILSNVRLPLDVRDSDELKDRQSKVFAIELKIPSLEISKILDNDSRLLGLDPVTHLLEFEPRRPDPNSAKLEQKVSYYRQTATGWQTASAPGLEEPLSHYQVSVDESLNTPPRIIATNRQNHRQSIVFDPNPDFTNLKFAQVEQLVWRDASGQEVRGGLYLPPDYTKDNRYPLVIQTHGFDPHKFWVDGPWTTGYAAQALANRGFAVLQVRGPDRTTEKSAEGTRAMTIYEEAVHYLDSKGIIDPDRVGIMGFSRTCFHVTYALTHSSMHFAAASIADGIDASYFQYISASNAESNFADDAEALNGGEAPFGEGLSLWMRNAPGFSMNKVDTPVLIQGIGQRSLLSVWEWFAGLSRLRKPVDLLYIPDGTHILEKPWDRLISQQGNVDWFCFWLKHEEDPSAPQQNYRWRKLRQLHDERLTNLPSQQ